MTRFGLMGRGEEPQKRCSSTDEETKNELPALIRGLAVSMVKDEHLKNYSTENDEREKKETNTNICSKSSSPKANFTDGQQKETRVNIDFSFYLIRWSCRRTGWNIVRI